MTFQIQALDPKPFAALFDMDNATLAAHNARRVSVDANPCYPCRISLQDAALGEEIILTNYTHQPAASPFQANHAIYIRKNVPMATPAPNEVPDMFKGRLASVRGFDAQDEICKADVVNGTSLADRLTQFFEDPAVRYVHIHNAKLGCFMASALRV
ncbi:MAG: DUF1203 domain-containing protein [Sulfitobacter sp.]